MCGVKGHVRFTPESGHWNSVSKCLLCARSGHNDAVVAQQRNDAMGQSRTSDTAGRRMIVPCSAGVQTNEPYRGVFREQVSFYVKSKMSRNRFSRIEKSRFETSKIYCAKSRRVNMRYLSVID